MFFLRSMVSKFVFWSLVLFVLVLVAGLPFSPFRAIWNNQRAGTHDWTYWQDQYKDIASSYAPTKDVKEATLATPNEVKQITVGQFALLQQDGTAQQRVDRCQSCHVGLENPQMTAENIIKYHDHVEVNAAQVPAYLDSHPETRTIVKTLGAHPGIIIQTGKTPQDLGVAHSPNLTYGVVTQTSPTDEDKADYDLQKVNLQQHPFPTFGCTTCHYGSGRDLIQDTAHGDLEHSLTPLLPAKYMEAACAQCHSSYDTKTFSINYLPQMQTIARGEQLFKQQACYGCHKIAGFSKGNVGPELTYEGRAAGGTVAIAHQLWDPRYKVGTCVMPYFFAVRQHNKDNPQVAAELVDPRAASVVPADIVDKNSPEYNEDIAATLEQHGYIPDKSRQADVDALITFVASQVGQNYADSQANSITNVAAYNLAAPPEVVPSVAVGKALFQQSGCYACHYIGNPNVKHITGDTKFGKGGVAGPELSWEGARHSQEWMVAHYKNPQEFVPGSIMPIFPLLDSQRAALSMYDASHRPAKPGARPVSPDQDLTTDAQKTAGAQNPTVRYMTR